MLWWFQPRRRPPLPSIAPRLPWQPCRSEGRNRAEPSTPAARAGQIRAKKAGRAGGRANRERCQALLLSARCSSQPFGAHASGSTMCGFLLTIWRLTACCKKKKKMRLVFNVTPASSLALSCSPAVICVSATASSSAQPWFGLPGGGDALLSLPLPRSSKRCLGLQTPRRVCRRERYGLKQARRHSPPPAARIPSRRSKGNANLTVGSSVWHHSRHAHIQTSLPFLLPSAAARGLALAYIYTHAAAARRGS